MLKLCYTFFNSYSSIHVKNGEKSKQIKFWVVLVYFACWLSPSCSTTCLGLTSVINLTTSPCSYLSYRTSNPLSISPDTSLISALLSTQWHQMIKKKKKTQAPECPKVPHSLGRQFPQRQTTVSPEGAAPPPHHQHRCLSRVCPEPFPVYPQH